MNERLLERFVALVRRELGATDVQVVPADAPEPGDHVVSGRLHDGRRVDITVEGDRASLLRRLQMLVSAFESALVVSNEPEELRRRPPTISLQEELRALATRAGALDAIVIDAHSPVVWASAQGWAMRPAVDEQVRQAIELQQQSRRDLIDALRAEMDEDEQGIANDAGEAPQGARIEPHHLSRRAIDDVRGLSALPSLRRGAHLAHMVRDDGFGYLARSFAGIYVVVVVFDHLFDELRAERAVRESLARVERLVLALPPLDPGPPAPQAGVVSLRPRRRR